jgi:hypothetical protein
MWFPQFRASKIEADMRRSNALGCRGMLGIHWRHRIVDPTATYFARAAWDARLTARKHYQTFARSQASGRRAGVLAGLFDACDTGHAITSTNTGKLDETGFVKHVELTADYHDGFKYRENEPDKALLPLQARTAARFVALARMAGSKLERERLGYLAGFVRFMVPYCDAYSKAHALDGVLTRAIAERKAGAEASARALVLAEGLPLWTALLPDVRTAVLAFQAVIATRNDLGQLASMQNKLVRIAVKRLRLSLEEFIGDLPAEAEAAYRAALAPDTAGPRVFLPTRPSILRPGEALRLFIVAPGVTSETAVVFRWRRAGAADWSTISARHEGRSVFSASLAAPVEVSEVEYRVEARGPQGLLSDPPGGDTHRATVFA